MGKSDVNLPQIRVVFVKELTKETIILPLSCLQGPKTNYQVQGRV